jgi:hypothetical protein
MRCQKQHEGNGTERCTALRGGNALEGSLLSVSDLRVGKIDEHSVLQDFGHAGGGTRVGILETCFIERTVGTGVKTP